MMSTPLTYLPSTVVSKLQDGGVAARNGLRVAEAPGLVVGGRRAALRLVTRQRLARRLQVELRDRLALLRRVDDRRVEDDVVGEQLVEPARQLAPEMGVPTSR